MSESSEELFGLICGRTTTKAVERILAAGYRKPRTITTVEELDALPVGSVIRTARAAVYEKGCFPDEPDFPYWLVTGMNREFASTVLALPATVLHEPEAGK